MLLISQYGNARLYRGLVGSRYTIEQHQCDCQKPHKIHTVHEHQKCQNHARSKKIQDNHNIPLIHSVRHNTAYGRQQNGRNKSTGRNHTVQRRGTCEIQQV